jgi:NAD(P)-dependent dehydrogenase (short-subunit alcohol dehydrogenase family)
MSQPPQQQDLPGTQQVMIPRPDCGEQSYRGHRRLVGKVALITGGDSGIGRAVAIAYAREGADVVISYLGGGGVDEQIPAGEHGRVGVGGDEEADARDTGRLVEEAGRRAVLIRGDLADPAHCREVVARTVESFGQIDILVINAAFQMHHETLEEISDEEWDRTMATNLSAMFHLCKAAVPHLGKGASIIASSSVNSDLPSPTLAPYAATKAAIANLAASLAQLLGPRGIRVNSVAPGPIWTPLIPATMPPERVEKFGTDTPLGRPGQPVELAPVYVLLASDDASYISGSRVAVTGGRPIL